MVHFVGAGPGAPDLITLRGARLLSEADQVIFAGSLVNPALLESCRGNCRILDSSVMTLEEVIGAIRRAEEEGKTTVRLHTGDPSLYGAIREQMACLDRFGIAYDVTPGVSSFLGASAALRTEYTIPGKSQTLILTRMAGRTPVPESESIPALAAHGSAMAVFLSAGMLPRLQEELLQGAFIEETPAAIVCRATWPDEKILRCPLGALAQTAEKEGIRKTALILVGDFLNDTSDENLRSRLYDPAFTTEYRKGTGNSA